MNLAVKARQAKQASIHLAATTTATKNRAIAEIARMLEQHAADIEAANQSDLNRSQKENLASPLLKRLKFDGGKIIEACKGLSSLIDLPDPVADPMLVPARICGR